MKKLLLSIGLGVLAFGADAQINIKKIGGAVQEKAKQVTNQKPALTKDEIVNGLKEALTKGARYSAMKASAADGFNKSNLIRIPFPEDAKKMETSLRKVGMGKKVDEFVVTLNRGAEEASKEAAMIFIDAVKKMSVKDGMNILKGKDNAATTYMNNMTNAQLYSTFKPIVDKALKKVEIGKYWNPLVTRYNKIPMVKKMNPDINDYCTKKAIEGLFKLIAIEEKKIRTDVSSRTTDLLKKVFAEQDKR